MWPNDYIDWACKYKDLVIKTLYHRLRDLAKEKSLVHDSAPELIAESAKKAFAKMYDWQRYPGLIADEEEFRDALCVAAHAEQMRLFLAHEYVAARLQHVPRLQRFAVLLRHAVGLSPGDVGPALGISPAEAVRAIEDGLRALCELL